MKRLALRQWLIQGLILGREKVQKVQKLAKHSVKQRETTKIRGGGKIPPLPPPYDPPLLFDV